MAMGSFKVISHSLKSIKKFALHFKWISGRADWFGGANAVLRRKQTILRMYNQKDCDDFCFCVEGNDDVVILYIIVAFSQFESHIFHISHLVQIEWPCVRINLFVELKMIITNICGCFGTRTNCGNMYVWVCVCVYFCLCYVFMAHNKYVATNSWISRRTMENATNTNWWNVL